MSVDHAALIARHARALERRRGFEGVWAECYEHVLPPTPGAGGPTLFDGTAADAAEQLAASLLAELTPPWARWAGLAALPGREDPGLDAALEQAAATLQAELDRSNFAVEMHQAFLDLVVAGTGVLLVEEGGREDASALSFAAVPLRQAVLEEGGDGRVDTVFRTLRATPDELRARFPQARLPAALSRTAEGEEPPRLPVLEAVWRDGAAHRYAAVLTPETGPALALADGRFAENPFIAFRWLKVPGETYGRGPVMKALPDIRTANKVVELVLKNASIAVTGIWQADDDGVLNPANVRLVPGAIIPKAVGSAGLTPLAPPGKFDVSQLILDDQRRRIRHALLADRLAPATGPQMTATEVLDRSAQMARLLGATYGRLQAELLAPLVARCLAILRRRGLVDPAVTDGRARVSFRGPLAQGQARADAANTLVWLQAVAALGAPVDAAAAAAWLGRTLGAPADLLIPASNGATA
jgi:hypothetical protein